MSIYPDRKIEKLAPTPTGGEYWYEVEETPGLIRRRMVIASSWETTRTDCFCCSCDEDRPGSDPYCRNHGFVAMRPCESHSMPGQEDEDGVLPDSVQMENTRHYG